MFGRRRHHQEEEAAREAERRALFEELAKRPDTICPFLGLASSRTDYRDGVTDEHRCYAFGDPAELSAEQQQKVCLQRGYGNCPRYLRGVLVIPTEELEALRRPLPAAPKPPAPAPAPAGSGGGGRRALVAVALVLLLAAGGGLGAFALLNRDGGVAQQTASPTPSATSSVEGSVTPTTTIAPSPTPPLETPPPEATPEPGDVFDHYEVSVPAGQNTVFRVSDAGEIQDELGTGFDDWSFAEVERIEAANGLLHWRTTSGDLSGWSYIRDRSGTFNIRAVYLAPDGSRRSELLPADQL
ncbi:MAG TPA: hypothetical protein VF013_08130 [Candidatus Limnocylindria bacterium]